MHRFLFIVLLGVFLAGCAAEYRPDPAERSMDPTSVVNRTWQWQGTVIPVEKITFAQPERYTIR